MRLRRTHSMSVVLRTRDRLTRELLRLVVFPPACQHMRQRLTPEHLRRDVVARTEIA